MGSNATGILGSQVQFSPTSPSLGFGCGGAGVLVAIYDISF